MTVSEIKQDLFTFFTTHDSFSIEDNFDDLYILSQQKEVDKALIKKALEEYVLQNVVTQIEITNDKNAKQTVWVLQKPLEQYSQTVELTFPTIANLTKLINDYCDQTKNREARVDPLNITEGNIQDLIVITHGVLNGNAE